MQWTKDKPKCPGWYWHRNKLLPSVQPSPVQVVQQTGGELIVCWNLSHVRMSQVSPESEFQGPITPHDQEAV